jgi:hypothetical protein
MVYIQSYEKHSAIEEYTTTCEKNTGKGFVPRCNFIDKLHLYLFSNNYHIFPALLLEGQERMGKKTTAYAIASSIGFSLVRACKVINISNITLNDIYAYITEKKEPTIILIDSWDTFYGDKQNKCKAILDLIHRYKKHKHIFTIVTTSSLDDDVQVLRNYFKGQTILLNRLSRSDRYNVFNYYIKKYNHNLSIQECKECAQEMNGFSYTDIEKVAKVSYNNVLFENPRHVCITYEHVKDAIDWVMTQNQDCMLT